MTCDNTANNNVMVEELMTLADGFARPAAHTQCLLHIINLVAKSLLRQFDVKKKDVPNNSTRSESPDVNAVSNSGKGDGTDDRTKSDGDIVCDQQALEGLMIEDEEDDSKGQEDEDEDSDEGWVDEVAEMSEAERHEFEKNIHPVKFTLAKVQ